MTCSSDFIWDRSKTDPIKNSQEPVVQGYFMFFFSWLLLHLSRFKKLLKNEFCWFYKLKMCGSLHIFSKVLSGSVEIRSASTQYLKRESKNVLIQPKIFSRKIAIFDAFSNSENVASITRRNLHGFRPAFADLSRMVRRFSVLILGLIGADPEELEPRKAGGPVMQSLSSSSTSYFTFWGEILQ